MSSRSSVLQRSDINIRTTDGKQILDVVLRKYKSNQCGHPQIITIQATGYQEACGLSLIRISLYRSHQIPTAFYFVISMVPHWSDNSSLEFLVKPAIPLLGFQVRISNLTHLSVPRHTRQWMAFQAIKLKWWTAGNQTPIDIILQYPVYSITSST